ncbi:hypothetical protein B0O99DRAFT_596144 [Bisporella sp. PMI_857]|nr:hypothetical protein B0O99DRAFT_596144 [Bisporella sp. PMI_857]
MKKARALMRINGWQKHRRDARRNVGRKICTGRKYKVLKEGGKLKKKKNYMIQGVSAARLALTRLAHLRSLRVPKPATSGSPSSSNVTTLPPEIHLIIFNRLGPVASTCLGLACKKFYSNPSEATRQRPARHFDYKNGQVLRYPRDVMFSIFLAHNYPFIVDPDICPLFTLLVEWMGPNWKLVECLFGLEEGNQRPRTGSHGVFIPTKTYEAWMEKCGEEPHIQE